MLKKVLLGSVAAAVLYCVGTNAFAETLTIRGSIIPGACSVNLQGGGLVDFGNLTGQEVRDFPPNGNTYAAPEKSIEMQIHCDIPTKIALELADNVNTTKLPMADAEAGYGYGLGVDGPGRPIGQYRVNFSKLQGTGSANSGLDSPVGFLLSLSDLGQRHFNSLTLADPRLFKPGYSLGFQFSGVGGVPGYVSRIEGPLDVYAFFGRDVIDNNPQMIRLNGSSTFTVHYY